MERNERCAPVPQSTAALADARQRRRAGGRGAQKPGTAATTQFHRKNQRSHPDAGHSRQRAPEGPRIAAVMAMRALCGAHSARKPALSWGRVAASSPFRNVRPHPLSERPRSYLPTLQSSSHPREKVKVVGNKIKIKIKIKTR
jgi:hypothetical protein